MPFNPKSRRSAQFPDGSTSSKLTDGDLQLSIGHRVRVAPGQSGSYSALVFFTRTGRQEFATELSRRECGLLATRLKPLPAKSEVPTFADPMGEDKRLCAQEYLRQEAELIAEATEADVVVSDEREEDLNERAVAFVRIADYVDWIEYKLALATEPPRTS